MDTKLLPDVSELDILIDGQPPAWVDNPIAVKIALEIQRRRAMVRDAEDQIEAIRSANGLDELEADIQGARETILDLALEMEECCGVKTITFAAGKVQLRPASTGFLYDKDVVDSVANALRAILTEITDVTALTPDSPEENAEIAALKRTIGVSCEGMATLLNKLAAARKDTARRASVALK